MESASWQATQVYWTLMELHHAPVKDGEAAECTVSVTVSVHTLAPNSGHKIKVGCKRESALIHKPPIPHQLNYS